MSLSQAQQIFQPEFLKQLNQVYINGNFGDAVMNPDTVAIVEYFKLHNPRLHISISTNGGARDRDFWQSLASARVAVDFCIDGIDEVHSLYRQNTMYSTVIKNAKIFIEAGGYAVWKMIDFDHNRHQQDQARKLSQELKFRRFSLVDHGRNQGPVFDKNKNLVHVMGNPLETNFEVLWKNRTRDTVILEDITNGHIPAPISCQVKKEKSLYVTSVGEVYPCCFLGFSPRTYGHGNYHAVGNSQLNKLIGGNNALERSLADCISWFDKIVDTWKIPTFEQGRLVICNDVCGAKIK
jgi:sulfatase maturation enzyme AslB (radical SAM superfamily)